MSARKEQLAENVTLYLGDWAKVMPQPSKNDAIITDPPYGLADLWQGGGRSDCHPGGWRFQAEETREWDQQAPDNVSVLPYLSNECVLWGGNYFSLPPSRCWLVWDKKQPDTFTTGQCELAWTSLDRPIRAFRFAQCEQANEGRKEHPTQKPVSLMLWCMRWISAAHIFDPYMGSGTTGVAAVQGGRAFTGAEINSRYFDIACRRISDELRRPRLFAEPVTKPVQEALFS